MKKLPFIYRIIARAIISRDDYEFCIGDLEELYLEKLKRNGKIISHLWLMLLFIKSLPPILFDNLIWSVEMTKNYLKIALRNLLGQKGYSFINISGLAVGIAVCIFILLWVRDELSFNRFHKNINNLYLAATLHDLGTEKEIGSQAPPALGPALKNEYPEILNAARYMPPPWAEFLVRCGDKSFTEGFPMGFA